MHIKLLYRKVLYVFLSLMIVFANTQTAFAASSWSVTGAVSAGARSVVSATKSGYKSAVNIAPTAGRLGLNLIKGANTAALAYAVVQIIGEGVDWVLDPANNGVRYTNPFDTVIGCTNVECTIDNAQYKLSLENEDARLEVCKLLAAAAGRGSASVEVVGNNCVADYYYSVGTVYNVPAPPAIIPIDVLASKVISNANSGHSSSQTATKDVAVEMVVGGQFDQDLLQGAVPTSDNKPLVPSVPISGNGNVTHGADTGIGDDGMSGASPGEQSDAAKDAADAARKAAQAAADAAKAAAEDARKAADDAADLVNSGADQAAIDAANDRAKAAEQAAADAKAAADAAVAAANERAAAAERAAEAATQAAAEAAAQAAKDLADAKAAGDAAAVAAAEAAKAAADAAVADAKAKQAAAEKAAEKAKAEAAKPFELPAFCSWATVVCDYTKWAKEEYANMSRWLKEEPTASPAELMPIDDDVSGIGNIFQDKAEAGYVSFASQCPADVLIPVSLMGASQSLNISYTPFCHFASLIRPAVILGAWISGLLIISGGRARE